MRFLVDECAGPVVARWLRAQNHDVFSVYEEARGMDDDGVIEKAARENRILITCDRHFGEKVYRERHSHRGVVLLRLEDERSVIKVETLRGLIEGYGDQLAGSFVVVTEARVRFARKAPGS